jgi:hypothetical protein
MDMKLPKELEKKFNDIIFELEKKDIKQLIVLNICIPIALTKKLRCEGKIE